MDDDFWFDVGRDERHRVELAFNRLTARLTIKVDGATVQTDRMLFSFKVTRRYEFTVGQTEQHAVAIEKRRALVYSAFLPSTYKVFIDGQHVQTF
jgi:Fas apoptotic inhibitory molecule (FAIM1)